MATRHVSLQKQTQLQLQLYLWFFFLSFSLPLSLPLFLALHSPLSCHFIFPNYSFSPSFLTILHGVQCTKYHNGNWANRFKKFCRIHCKMRGWGGKYPRETHHRHHRHLLLLNLVVHEHTQKFNRLLSDFLTPLLSIPKWLEAIPSGWSKAVTFMVLPWKLAENCTAFPHSPKSIKSSLDADENTGFFLFTRLLLTYCTRCFPRTTCYFIVNN